jgi:tocopherol cyclase
MYQGGTRDGRFEGWYFKAVDASGTEPFAVIPGVSWDEAGGTSHAFVQVVRAGGHTRYFRYPASDFSFEPMRTFGISVGDNVFTQHGMSLDLADEEGRVSGELLFGPWTPWPVHAFSPGIMGWYRFVPRMECYHGVLSMDHAVSGSVAVGDETLTFDGGRGYIEKDWGTSFPSSWVWAQTNTFPRPGVSLTFSVARIPWVGSAFVGSIAGLLLDGELHRFATYTGAKLVAIETEPCCAHAILRGAHEELEVNAEGAAPAPLKAPMHGRMIARADEALGATVAVTLRRLTGPDRSEVLFDGVGRAAGVEVMDQLGELVP